MFSEFPEIKKVNFCENWLGLHIHPINLTKLLK